MSKAEARGLEPYSDRLANDLKHLANTLGLPLKILYRWKAEWLSYPVTEEDYRMLALLTRYVWGDMACIRAQLSNKSKADRFKLINDVEVSKPIAMLRNILLEMCRANRRCPPSRVLIDMVRSRYPNGYQLIDANAIRSAKRWAKQMACSAEENVTISRLIEGRSRSKTGKRDPDSQA